MMSLLPIIVVICLTIYFTYVLKQKFEKILPITFFLIILILYIFSFFRLISVGCILIAIGALIGGTYVLLNIKKNKEIKENILTPGFIIFNLIAGFVCVLNWRRGFTVWDEISHWGPMVKEMFRLDTFYTIDASALSVHKDYPPAISLVEVFWCKLSGSYKEYYLYRALQIFSFSLFLPMLSEWKFKKKYSDILNIVIATTLCIVLPMVIRVGEAGFYETIYSDCILAILFAYGIFVIILEKNEKFKILSLCLSFSILLITKQMGMALYMLSFGIYLLCDIVTKTFERKNIEAKSEKVKKKYIFLFLVFIPCFICLIWSIYVKHIGASAQFSIGDLKIQQIWGIMKGSAGEKYQHQVYVAFKKAIFTEALLVRPIELAYWQILLSLSLLFYMIYKYGNECIDKAKCIIVGISICVGAVCYAFAMLLLYVFSFSELEGSVLASYHRYMATYLYAFAIFLVMFFVYVIIRREENSVFIPLFFLEILIMTIIMEPKDIQTLIPVKEYYSSTMNFIPDQEIIQKFVNNNEKILMISQEDNGNIGYKLSYLIIPRICDEYIELDLSGKSEEQLYKDFSNYDYLYLQDINENFINKYGNIFPNKELLADGQFYRIKNQKDGSELELLN